MGVGRRGHRETRDFSPLFSLPTSKPASDHDSSTSTSKPRRSSFTTRLPTIFPAEVSFVRLVRPPPSLQTITTSSSSQFCSFTSSSLVLSCEPLSSLVSCCRWLLPLSKSFTTSSLWEEDQVSSPFFLFVFLFTSFPLSFRSS